MSLTVVILTFNESLHIERAIMSALCVADDVLVVDSYSMDETVTLSKRLGAKVLVNKWVNHATQMNWALQNGDIQSDWVMRLDADEFIDDKLVASINKHVAEATSDVAGFEVNRRIRFMGKQIRHGGMSPMWVTRLWRNGLAKCESRWMDEHMVLTQGNVARLEGNLVDDNLNSLTWWTQKHNHYASREAVDLLDRHLNLGMADEGTTGLNRQARIKRFLKTRVYSSLPLGVRPWLYFFYRVFLRLGILDGGWGMIFHTLQGLWYRLLVDAKVREVMNVMEQNDYNLNEAVSRVLEIELGPSRHELAGKGKY